MENMFKMVFWAALGCGVVLVVGGIAGKNLLAGFSNSSGQFSAALEESLPLAPQEIQAENDSVVPESKVNSNFNKIIGGQTQTVSNPAVSPAVNVVAAVPSLQTSAPASVIPPPVSLPSPQPSQPAMPSPPAPAPAPVPVPAPTPEPSPQSQIEISAPPPAQPETPAPAPEPAPKQTPKQTPAPSQPQDQVYYTSSYKTAKYYYPSSCNGWKSLSKSYLKVFNSLAELLAAYPSKTLSPSCK